MKILKTLLITLVLFLFLSIVWFILILPDQIYVFDRYIDTEMASGYTPGKFNTVSVGQDKLCVDSLLGKPLFIDQERNTTKLTYTNDGKLLNSEEKWYRANDYAWYRSSLILDSNNKVIYIDKGWSYD